MLGYLPTPSVRSVHKYSNPPGAINIGWNTYLGSTIVRHRRLEHLEDVRSHGLNAASVGEGNRRVIDHKHGSFLACRRSFDRIGP
jgi:hypothetical protein